ncbi:MAG TPA: VanZ family protein [bacterium]|nr:VanZ family protein [bacterium]
MSRSRYMPPPGLLKKRLLLLGALCAFILISGAFTRRPINAVRAAAGAAAMTAGMAAAVAAAAGAFLLWIRPWRMPAKRASVFLAVLAAGAAVALLVPAYPEERIHLLEYALVGWLAYAGLSRPANPVEWIAVPVLFGVFLGAADELVQFYLPDRVGDFRDVVFNSCGSAWGVLLVRAADPRKRGA